MPVGMTDACAVNVSVLAADGMVSLDSSAFIDGLGVDGGRWES